ncbi:PEP/pyruvate-binding domain-containing protein [Agromyces laixinhei]|uniref:PEP/pyruvate-binding domain-containing protein n=1 Tax=Agromyces laixinhei TaxID=2585717 RepID=UPI0018DC69C8|nr:PEP/pyruvate-binding domain-containing protein [Agromyces laixinhei]
MSARGTDPVMGLDDIGRDDLDVAGGKGASLGELLRGGFRVPAGFVVTTGAYRQAFEDAALAEEVPSAAMNDADADRVRAAVGAMTVPAGVEAAIIEAYRALGRAAGDDALAVAVRSSATAEDLPGATFAGQQDTFLNVVGTHAVVDAVRRCWASLWTQRAVAYRTRAGIDHREVSIAVVVQVLVDADTAGVMFTANPVTGARDETIIDASPGLGEAVVSGRVTPDHFVVGADGGVRQRRLGRREVIIVPDAGGGVREIAGGGPDEPDEPDAPDRLDDDTLRSMAAVGTRIAEHFGGPQDIEWVSADGQISIVQARSLTALPPEPVRVNAIRRLMTGIVAELLPIRPTPLDMTTWTVHGHGRILTRMLAEIPAIRISLADMLPEADGVVDRLVPPDPHPSLRTPATPFRMAPRIRCFRTERWNEDPRFAEFDREVEALRAIDLGTLGWTELVRVPRRALDILDGLITLRIDYLPRAGFDLLRLRMLLGVLGLGRDASSLTRGVRTRTGDANAALSALAAAVAADAAWREAFESSTDAELEAKLAASHELDDLRARIADFTNEYGHRETTSAFLASEPTWGDDPAMLFGAVRALLVRTAEPAPGGAEPDAGPGVHPGDGGATAAERRIRGRRRVRFLRLGDKILAVAAHARSGIAFREDSHFHAMRPMPPLRHALLEAGARLVSAGVLAEPQEVFHLRYEELLAIDDPAAVSARQHSRLRAAVEQRARRRGRYAGAPLVSPLTLRAARSGDDVVVSGTPAGGGRSTGPARIIREVADFARLQPGDILVCPYTNPSWTPLFQLAAGVVVDTGGLASHAAIVAREYGLPTVMGTGGGTSALRDGQIVTVDGGTGLVSIEPAS